MSDENFIVRVKWGGASPLTEEDAVKIAEFGGAIIRKRNAEKGTHEPANDVL